MIESSMPRAVYLDCFSGLSGDMIVSALIDVGVPFSEIEKAAAALPLSGYRLRHEKEMRGPFHVSRFFVDVDEGAQPHRHFSHIRDMINGASFPARVKEMSIGIFEVLADAEARVHGTTIEKVHFHEVGAVDSIIDIVGAAVGVHFLDAQLMCRTVPLGTGFVNSQHGVLPLPAPATLKILEGVPVEGTDIPAELTTPTGAAIVKALATHFGPLPAMRPIRSGFGAGSRDLPQRPGVLRAVLGEVTGVGGASREHSAGNCTVLEANIDDMTGEMAAHALSRLFEHGALDVWMTPIQMKKGRPATKMSVLCRRDDRERMGRLLMRETTTIGLRHYDVGRMEMRRDMVTAETEFGKIRLKVSTDDSGAQTVSPEFEDCRRLATSHDVALKDVMTAAIVAFHGRNTSGDASD